MPFGPNLQSTDRVSYDFSIDMAAQTSFQRRLQSWDVATDHEQADSAKRFSDRSSLVDRSELKTTALCPPVAKFGREPGSCRFYPFAAPTPL
jgi:hypothetical protein